MRRILSLLFLGLLILSVAACGNSANTPGSPASTPSASPSNGSSVTIPSQQLTPTASPGKTSATPTHSTQPTSTPVATPTHSGNPPASPTPTSLEAQLEQQLFNLINSDRAKNGLPPYVRNTTLDGGARQHSIKMSKCGLSHQCPGEPAPCDRVTQEGMSWNYCGENVGEYGPVNANTAWNGVQALETAMLNEKPPDDGHRRNLLSTNFHHIGIGIYIDGNGTLWLTEDFTN